MATREEIITEMEKFRTKLLDENYARHIKGWNKTMQYHFKDTDQYYYIKLSNGVPEEVIEGQVEKPEISYQMTTDDYIALMRGEVKGLKLYNSGKLKIKASMPDIIKLQKLE